jgi:hypothetical protein
MKGTYRNPRQRHADVVRSEARAQALNNRLAMVASSTSATLAASQARMAQLRAGGALTWQVPSPAPAPSAIAGAVFAAPVPPPNYTAPAPYVPPPAPLESKPMLEMPKWMMTAGQSAASDAAKASSAADAAAAAETAAASAAFMQAYKAAPTVKEEEPSLEAIFGGPAGTYVPPRPGTYVPAPAPAPAKVPSGIRRIHDSSEILPASGRQEDDEVMPLPSEVRRPPPAARRPPPAPPRDRRPPALLSLPQPAGRQRSSTLPTSLSAAAGDPVLAKKISQLQARNYGAILCAILCAVL